MSYWNKVEPLCADHVLDGFTCGDDDMDAWFHGNARHATAVGSAAVTVCTHPDDGIVGFFALVNHEVRTTDVGVAPRDTGGLTTIPATLLARMGLRDDLRRQNIGTDLLFEALRLAVGASTAVGSRLIVLDAKNDRLAEWYAARSFTPTRANPLRLYMKMSTARRAVQARI
ncbi:hypothetical protein ACXYX3_01880 [Mycobacterium sp. C3-094]